MKTIRLPQMKKPRLPQKHVAPAEVEGSTGATPYDVRGDGYPLHATYDGPSTLATSREVVYVALDSGQAFTMLFRRSEGAPTRYPGISDIRTTRVLAFDAYSTEAENIEHAKLVANCLVANGTAKVAPITIMRALVTANQQQAEKIRELQDRVAHLEADNEALYKRSRR